eukprot:5902560-Pleurochrysis_carterae.AAC.2
MRLDQAYRRARLASAFHQVRLDSAALSLTSYARCERVRSDVRFGRGRSDTSQQGRLGRVKSADRTKLASAALGPSS